MFAGKVGHAILCRLRQHPPAAYMAAMVGNAGLALFGGFVFGAGKNFPDKGRGFFPVGQDRDGCAGTGKRDIEKAALFGVGIVFRFRQNQIQQRIIDDLGREAHNVRDGLQDNDVIGLKSFRRVDRHKFDGEFRKGGCEGAELLRACVAIAAEQQNAG